MHLLYCEEGVLMSHITEPVIFDRSSDLTVVVGLPDVMQAECKVSRKAMRLASPVWDAMLDPAKPYVESNSTQVAFEDDDLEAFIVLLYIAHCQFRKLPNTLSYNRLLHLTVLCDKYDTVGLVRPFLPAWVEPWKKFAHEKGFERFLCVAYTFGFINTFESMVRNLVRLTEIDSTGECVVDGCKLDTDMCDGITDE